MSKDHNVFDLKFSDNFLPMFQKHSSVREFCSIVSFFQDEYIDMIKKPSKIKRNDIQFWKCENHRNTKALKPCSIIVASRSTIGRSSSIFFRLWTGWSFCLVPGVCTWHLASRCQVPTPGTWHQTKSRQVGYPWKELSKCSYNALTLGP